MASNDPDDTITTDEKEDPTRGEPPPPSDVRPKTTYHANVTDKTGEEKKQPTWTEKLEERTISKIKEWTCGTVVTSAFTNLMKKLNSGTNWITITGQPGEGKTTAAYMALKELQESGRQVIQVLSPNEFIEVTTTCSHPVILLDEILGQEVFDDAEWSRWEPIIRNILGDKEEELHEKASKEKKVTVVFIGRNYVLDKLSSDIGKISRFFKEDEHVVLMSKSGERDFSEKVAILEAICEFKGVHLDEETMNTICTARGPHGFPHACRMFVNLSKDGVEMDTARFMKSPLEFLNTTVQTFLIDTTKLLLFKEMIKRDGKITVLELHSLNNSHAVIKLADSLLDSYLRKEDDCYSFHYPAIYDSVLLNLLQHEPLFVIEHCSVSFLHERLRLEPSRDTQQSTSNSESNRVVNIPRCFITDLAKRFAAEIENRELMLVLSHKVFTDQLFIEELKSHVKLPPTSLLTLTDKQTDQSFLELLVSSKHFELLKYVISVEPDLNAKDRRGSTVLHHLCEYSLAEVEVMRFLIAKGASVKTTDKDGWSALHVACFYSNSQAVQCLLDHGANVKNMDHRGDTSLHIAAAVEGSIECVSMLLNAGADVTAHDTWGSTPLDVAKQYKHKQCIELLEKSRVVID